MILLHLMQVGYKPNRLWNRESPSEIMVLLQFVSFPIIANTVFKS